MIILGSLESVVDFLLAFIELLSLDITAEALRTNIGLKNQRFRSNGDRLTQNFR